METVFPFNYDVTIDKDSLSLSLSGCCDEVAN